MCASKTKVAVTGAADDMAITAGLDHPREQRFTPPLTEFRCMNLSPSIRTISASAMAVKKRVPRPFSSPVRGYTASGTACPGAWFPLCLPGSKRRGASVTPGRPVKRSLGHPKRQIRRPSRNCNPPSTATR